MWFNLYCENGSKKMYLPIKQPIEIHGEASTLTKGKDKQKKHVVKNKVSTGLRVLDRTQNHKCLNHTVEGFKEVETAPTLAPTTPWAF